MKIFSGVRLLALCLLALFAVAGTVAAARADEVSIDVLKAETLSKQGKADEALALLNRVIANNPKNARALVDRGDIYQSADKHREAIADYTAAIAINPEYAYAFASRCESRRILGQYKDALSDCDKSISLQATAYALRQRALIHLEMEDGDLALSDANRAVDLDSTNSFSFSSRCRVYFALKRYDEAAKDCDAALGLDENNEQAAFYRGRVYVAKAQWADAEGAFTKLLGMDADQTGAFYWRALSRFETQKFDAALSDINTYIAKNADDADGYMVRARIEKSQGHAEDARRDATQALRHYRIDNDTDGAANAQQFLDSLSGSK